MKYERQQCSTSHDASKEVSKALALIDFTSGFIAGTAQLLVSQPFDTVKVKQQSFSHLYNGMIDCFLKTFQNEGLFHGLYSGSLPAWLANVGESSVLFAAYGGCREVVAKIMRLENSSELPLFGEALAGSFSSFFTSFVICPTELVKCKLQALNEVRLMTNERNRMLSEMTMVKMIRNIYVVDGIPGFYRGLSSTLVREMPGYFFFFGCYEGTREFFRKPGTSRNDVGPLVTILAGSLAGIMLWSVTFPADVIKSRIQVNNMSGGMLTVGRKILKEEGLLALYSGLLPSIVRTIPATAVLFLVFEHSKKTLSNVFNIHT